MTTVSIPGRSLGAAPVLSLAEYAVLGVVAEGRQHGFAVARLLGSDGEVGGVYAVARPAVYRAIERLIDAGLIRPLKVEVGERGPRRTPLRVTSTGRKMLDAWMWEPVRHVREIRTAFLVKLLLIDRAELDPSHLIRSQIAVLSPVVDALAEHHRGATGSERAVSLWRWRSAQATSGFLEELAAERSSAGPG
jgi:DNA-binding PadR family transcriptional regulator